MKKSRNSKADKHAFGSKESWVYCSKVESTEKDKWKHVFDVILMAPSNPFYIVVRKTNLSLFIGGNIFGIGKYLQVIEVSRKYISVTLCYKAKYSLLEINLESNILTIHLNRCRAVRSDITMVFAINKAMLIAYTLKTSSSTAICILLIFPTALMIHHESKIQND